MTLYGTWKVVTAYSDDAEIPDGLAQTMQLTFSETEYSVIVAP